MASRVKFPIRTKLLLLMAGMSLLGTVIYLALAVRLFRADKIELVYELNASGVRTLSAQVQTSLLRLSDKTRLLVQGHREAAWAKTVFESEPDLVSFTLYEPGSSASEWRQVTRIRSPEFAALYPAGEPAESIPFALVLSRKSLAWNSTASGGAPLLSFALALDVEDHAQPMIGLLEVRLDGLQKLVSERGIATRYVVDWQGRIVAHPNPDWVRSHRSVADLDIVREGLQSPVAYQVRRYSQDGQRFLGGWGSIGLGGLSVISQVDETSAFGAARRLIEKSVLFAALVITGSILLAGWLAGTLIRPLNRLVEATERLARWQFGGTVNISSNDEVAVLARAFTSMAADIQRQHMELEASKADLEIKVRERTAALEKEKQQAAAAQEVLVRTTRLAALGELAGATAHEVLNPINNISVRVERSRGELRGEVEDAQLLEDIVEGWRKAYGAGGFESLHSELSKKTEGRTLLEEDLENLRAIAKDQRQRVERKDTDGQFVLNEISRITRLLNGMRGLSRVAGERVPLDIHVPIDDTVVAMGDQMERHSVKIIKEYSQEPRDLFTILGDRDELMQVFSNLLRNALQAILSAERRAGEIRVSTQSNGDRVEIRIADNGTGIARDHLPKIFEASFTTKTVSEGTGLGLSISRRIVRAFGGDLEVASTTEGRGAVFLVWLPRMAPIHDNLGREHGTEPDDSRSR